MRLVLELDTETAKRLVRAGIEDNRPMGMQAEELLKRTLRRRFAAMGRKTVIEATAEAKE